MRDTTPDHFAIDVIIPVFNGGRYILRAVETASNQTHAPKKIIVVDDGSTDNTVSLIAECSFGVPLEVIRQENRGLSAARNTGIKKSTSEYVAFLDADDEWYPRKLEEQANVFSSSTIENLGVVYSNYCLIDVDGSVLDVPSKFICSAGLRGNIYEELLYGNRISGSGSGILVKRECFEKVGLFDEGLQACEDWDMWLRLAAVYGFDHTQTVLVKIRQHVQNMQKDRNKMFRNSLLFFSKWCTPGKEDAHLQNWRDTIVYRIAEDLPRFEALQLTQCHLSRPAGNILFRHCFGSLWLYLLCRFPAIIIILLKRMFRIKEYA